MNDDLKLGDVLRLINANRRFIAIGVLLIVFVYTTFGFFVPLTYVSKIRFIPNTGQGQAKLGEKMTGEISSILSQGNRDSEVKFYKSLLGSKRFFRSIVKTVGLEKFYAHNKWNAKEKRWVLEEGEKVPTLEATVNRNYKRVKLRYASQKNLVTVSYKTVSPELAFAVIKAIEVKLNEFLNKMEYVNAHWHTQLVEEKANDLKRQRLELGKKISHFYSNVNQTGVSSKFDINLGSMNWDQVFDKTVLTEFSDQEKERVIGENRIVHDVPRHIYLEYLNATKYILNQSSELLLNYREAKKIDERQKRLSYEIVDEATLVMTPSNRPVFTHFIVSLIAGTLFVVFVVFSREYFRWLKVSDQNV